MNLLRTLAPSIVTTLLMAVLATCLAGDRSLANAGAEDSRSPVANTACEHLLDSQFQYGSAYACIAEATASPVMYLKRTVSIDCNSIAGCSDGVSVAWRRIVLRGPAVVTQDSSTLRTLCIRLQV